MKITNFRYYHGSLYLQTTSKTIRVKSKRISKRLVKFLILK